MTTVVLAEDRPVAAGDGNGASPAPGSVLAFELHEGRLRQVRIHGRSDFDSVKPIWVDLVAPSDQARAWLAEAFRFELPDPADLGDLEASARFYIEDNGDIHLHSDFLLVSPQGSRNVAVAFVLHDGILFSVRTDELPVFRVQRLRASTMPGYVSNGIDVLLDLYAADVEYSAEALEAVYEDLERVGRRVLDPKVSDETAARILSEIAKGEDLNGRIRRNVLDTRRAASFLTRSETLSARQTEEAREIVRDIESLDSHTSFLFGKVNFLMDAVVGFININQNRRVSKLTSISIVFLPINILAGIGGMSEVTGMTHALQMHPAWGYFAFIVGCAGIGWITYLALRWFEAREALEAGREAAESAAAAERAGRSPEGETWSGKQNGPG